MDEVSPSAGGSDLRFFLGGPDGGAVTSSSGSEGGDGEARLVIAPPPSCLVREEVRPNHRLLTVFEIFISA